MRKLFIILHTLVVFTTIAFSPFITAATNDPLPSWNEGPAKAAILNFIHTTTDKQSPQYIPPEQIIGSALNTQYSYDKNGSGVLMRASKLLLSNK